MLIQQLGQSRTSLRKDHFFQSPDSFVRAPLPGMTKATAIVHAGPALGARFTEYTAEMEAGGTLGPTTAQRFVCVLGGEIEFRSEVLPEGAFGFVPQGQTHHVRAIKPSRVVVIEKPYQVGEFKAPEAFIGKLSEIEPTPLMGDEGVLVQSLVPEKSEFDFAVNLMTFAPGSALGLVESHIMEHGLLMLEGGGIYRLGDAWYPTMAGDFIWMAPYCPQWFGAIGKHTAKYLIYKDWNRHPL